MKLYFPALLLGQFILAGCAATAGAPDATTPDIAGVAQRIAQSRIIVDTHIDVPYRLKDRPADVSVAADGGDFDYPRAVAGGLNAAFMSIYTPAKLEAEGGAREAADELIDLVEALVEQSPEKFAIARSVRDVRMQFDAGLMSLPMGMENGSPLEGDLDSLTHFFNRGIRYITLAHSLSNHLSDSSYDDNRQWDGLSEFGRDVVREMNRLGIMIDVSHLSDAAFWQVIETSTAPVIASHSSARHFTPGFERNMSDAMIVGLAKTGGVIQINFGSAFILQATREYSTARQLARKQYLAENPELLEEEIYRSFAESYAEEHGAMPLATLEEVLDHFDHVVKLVGVDHVGIGSDYDGVGDSLPTGLKDVSSYPNLVEGLLRRGYSEADVVKILGENLLRVWQAVEDAATS